MMHSIKKYLLPITKRAGLVIFSLIALGALVSACGAPSPEPGAAASPSPQPASTSQPPAEIPEALQAALHELANQLNLSADQIQLQSIEKVEWRDSCLGLAQGGEMCAQVITPGYRAIFSTPDGQYEIHTDESGTSFRIASPSGKPLPTSGGMPVVEWQRSGGIAGVCQALTIDEDGNYQYTDCRAPIPEITGTLGNQQMDQLNSLLSRYGNVEYTFKPPQGSADMFNDHFTLYGTGNATPSPEEETNINEFLASLAASLQPTAPAPAQGDSGIQGQALIGPACPGPVRVSSPCPDQPYQATIQVLSQSGEALTQFRTDQQGQFRVSLPPGTYRLHPLVQGALPRAEDQTVTVQPGQYTQVQINFDSGMR